jgi:hypothetical protein
MEKSEFEQPPPFPASFPELEFKTADELQRLLNDESELYLMMEDVAFFKGLTQLRDQARDANVRKCACRFCC